ncbi:MAG: flagellar export protein FliJ [bacterium]|nr:flagellar export protein FliJ [bacterium]
MKRFNFKLKNVLKYRETLENLAKNEYQEALRLLNLDKEILSSLLDRRESIKSAYDIKAGSIVDPVMLTFVSDYTSQILALIDKQHLLISQKEKIAKEKFDNWNIKRKDVKVINKLEEKKKEEYLREVEKEEQSFQDEIFIAKTVREMKK